MLPNGLGSRFRQLSSGIVDRARKVSGHSRQRRHARDSQASQPAIDLLLGLILRQPIPDLQLADQKIPAAADRREVVVGQSAPVGLGNASVFGPKA